MSADSADHDNDGDAAFDCDDCGDCDADCALLLLEVRCAGLREGRHLMRVAAGMVVLPFTGLLKEGIYPVWSCC